MTRVPLNALVVVSGLGAGLGCGVLVSSLASCTAGCDIPPDPVPGSFVIVDSSHPELVGGTVDVYQPDPADGRTVMVVRYGSDEVEYQYFGRGFFGGPD